MVCENTAHVDVSKLGIASSPTSYGISVPGILPGRFGPPGPPPDYILSRHLPDDYGLSVHHPLSPFGRSQPSLPFSPLDISQAVVNEPVRIDQSSVPAPSQPTTIILPLLGISMDPLCVDITNSQGPMTLLSDPYQGLEVTGQHELAKAGFEWISLTFKNPELQVHATPEHVVVTRNRKNSEYKWKETLFSVLPGLKMTMDNTGLLLFSGKNRVTIGLLPGDGPGKGLLLLLRDTHHFSGHINGTLGQFYQDAAWDSPVPTDDNTRTLRVQGRDYPATRELKLDYQDGFPGAEISCWSVKL